MKSPRIGQLAMFAMAVFSGVETASADISYSFTTIDAPPGVGNTNTFVYGINNSGQIVGTSTSFGGAFVDTGGSFTKIVVPGLPVAPIPMGSTTAARSWEAT